jgi:hypothetical protein
MEVKSVNLFEVDGPVSLVEVEMDGAAQAGNDQLGPVAAEEEGKVAGMLPLKSRPRDPAELKPVAFAEKLEDKWINMWFKPGHWVEWAAHVPAAGKYAAILYYGSSYYPRREVSVNGRVVPGLESVTLSYTGGWRSWKQATLPAPLDLQAGRNTIRLTCLDQTGAWLKLIRLTPVAANGMKLDLPASAYVAEGGGKVQRTLIPGTGFLMYSEKGHWMEWDVVAPAAGEYDLYLVVGALVEASRMVKVNGNPVAHPNHFKIYPTGGWRVFTEIPFGKASLRQGMNIVRTENLTADCPNLAGMRLVKDTGEEIIVKAVEFAREGGGKARKP